MLFMSELVGPRVCAVGYSSSRPPGRIVTTTLNSDDETEPDMWRKLGIHIDMLLRNPAQIISL
jgi:hypothetical protein